MKGFKGTKGDFVYNSKYNTIEVNPNTSDRGLRPVQTIAIVNSTFISEEECHANGRLLGASKIMFSMLQDILEEQDNGNVYHSYKIKELINEINR